MDLLLQRTIDGVAIGAIYASIALAIALVYLATGTINLAQGSMGMLCAFIVWKLSADHPATPGIGASYGLPLLLGIVVGIVAGVALGAVLERVVIRPVEGSTDHLPVIIVTLGLLLIINSGAGYFFTTDAVPLASPFPAGALDVGGVSIEYSTLGLVVVVLIASAAVSLLFARTRLGLHMRAVVDNRESAQLVGVRSGRMLMIGWGLAGGIGALSAILIAPTTLVSTGMMDTPLFLGVAGAALGGFTSAGGAVLGGFIIGLLQSLVPAYVPFVSNNLALAVTFVVMLAALLAKPSGLFGKAATVRL